MTRPPPTTPPAAPRPAAAGRRRPAGFTLNELLIVIAVAVLIVGLAIPAFNAITGSRSMESAENRIASYLGAARSDAIGLQQPRGVIFFEDRDSRLITMAQVYFPPGQSTTLLTLDLYGGRDEMTVPTGIGLRAVPDGGGQYINWPTYGLVLFDGDGRLMQERFTIAGGSDLDKRLPKSGPNDYTVRQNLRANIGFVLYDRPAFEEQVGTTAQEKWMQENAVPFLVNRYSGSLIRAE